MARQLRHIPAAGPSPFPERLACYPWHSTFSYVVFALEHGTRFTGILRTPTYHYYTALGRPTIEVVLQVLSAA
jgi:hypothetical protein